jgi:hypothetical protein
MGQLYSRNVTPYISGAVRREIQPAFPDPAAMPRPRRSAALAVVATWLLALLAVAEMGPRVLGRHAWRYSEAEKKEPALVEPDPFFGWVNKPGHWVLPPHLAGGVSRKLTNLPDHSRTTGTASDASSPRDIFVGCSVTNGYGLSDADTFAWKIQQSHPDMHVVNFGTPAYSTFQSLLRMERELDQASPPRLVVYGFITQHEARNVATYDWLRGLALNSYRGHVAPPYVTLGPADALVRHPPEAFSIWPLADHSVLTRMAGDAYMHLLTWGRGEHGTEATKRLIAEMNALARRRATRFAVAFLLAEDGKKEAYTTFFAEHRIPYIDCVEPLTEDNRIPDEGHPNGKINSVWAQCISEKLLDSPSR